MVEIEIYELGFTSPRCKAALATVTKCLVDAILGMSNPINLKRLRLKMGYPRDIDSVRLVTALNKIEILEVQLREEDASLLFKVMMHYEGSVTSLSLLGNLSLSRLEPEPLFHVFDKLKVFGARCYNLPLEAGLVKTLFEKIASGTNLKKLRIDGCPNLSQVSPGLLRNMVAQLEELELKELDGDHTTPYLFRNNETVKIVTAIATTETSNLKKLNICSDMRSINYRLLSKMATKVEDLTLEYAVENLKTIFQISISNWPGKLRRLKVIGRSTNLDTLDADILARVANNLECFEFSHHSFLTVNQTENILSLALKTKSHLKRLHVWVQGCSSNLDPLVREAEKIIPELNIHYKSGL